MIDMSFYFDRRCKISAMLFFFFFFCGTKNNLQNSQTPNPPPPKKKKKKILCYKIGSFLQAKPYLLTGKMTQAHIQMCV